MKKNEIIKVLEGKKVRSAWERGVNEYAIELLENIDNNEENITEKALLNGASDWNEYSWSGCSLICDCDICKRLCNNTEKKLTRNGKRRPNRREQWLDTQARALFQACNKILDLVNVEQ